MFQRYVAIGDSFTEGVGDELPNGQLRGWADLVALGLAEASALPVSYANLAIRGKLLGPIVREQLAPALALKPDLLTISGGGNDLMRPHVEIGYVIGLTRQVVDRALDAGAHVVLVSGGNPSRHLPMGALMQRRGDALAAAVVFDVHERRHHAGGQLERRRVDPGAILVTGQAALERARAHQGRHSSARHPRRACTCGVGGCRRRRA